MQPLSVSPSILLIIPTVPGYSRVENHARIPSEKNFEEMDY